MNTKMAFPKTVCEALDLFGDVNSALFSLRYEIKNDGVAFSLTEKEKSELLNAIRLIELFCNTNIRCIESENE